MTQQFADARAQAAVSGGMVRPMVATWRGLVRTYRDVEDTPWGRLLLANVWPAYLFALPLAAKVWGFIGRLRDPVAHGAEADPRRYQAVLAQEAATILFFGLVVLLFIIRRPVRGRHASWQGGVVALVGTFLLNVVGFLPNLGQPSTDALLLSTAIVLGGTGFTIWSLASLGRCFGVFPEARGLVTRGPYRWVRHPVYLGELISAVGLLVTKPHPLVLALFLLFVLFQYWRTVYEERALSEVFPREYPAYRARTGRLVPWRGRALSAER